MRASRSLPPVAAAMVVAASVLGCGGGGGDNGAVDLTKWLPPTAGTYAVADLATLREDLDLPEDADPLDGSSGRFGTLSEASVGLVSEPPFTSPEFIAALDLGAVDAAASSLAGDSTDVTVLSTSADTGDIGSALGDLGFEDVGGVLAKHNAPSVRLTDGLIFLGGDPAALRELPDEPLDELPTPLLDGLEGASINTHDVGFEECSSGFGTASDADGSGVFGFLVDGGADPARLVIHEGAGLSFGEPEVDGELITVPVGADGASSFAARETVRTGAVSYDCG